MYGGMGWFGLVESLVLVVTRPQHDAVARRGNVVKRAATVVRIVL